MLSIAPTLNAFAGPLNVPAPRVAVKMAVESPITKVAGDYGFDPLGLGTVRHASVTPARSPTPLTPLPGGPALTYVRYLKSGDSCT